MKLLFIFICIGMAFASTAMPAREVTEQRREELVALLKRDELGHIDMLPGEEREFIRLWCLEDKRRDDPNPRLSSSSKHLRLLLEAGDSDALNWLCESLEFNPGQFIGMAAESRQPKLISRIAPGMFKVESGKRHLVADVLMMPYSVGYAHIICEILADSHEIPDAVRIWAKAQLAKYENDDDGETFRSTIRVWYSANEAVLLAQDWKALRPSPPVSMASPDSNSALEVNEKPPTRQPAGPSAYPAQASGSLKSARSARTLCVIAAAICGIGWLGRRTIRKG